MTDPKRDLKAESEAFEERLSICIIDGGLSYEEALKIADQQLWATIKKAQEKKP